MRTAKSLFRLGGCPGWSESSLGAHSFCCCFCLLFFFCLYFFFFRVTAYVTREKERKCDREGQLFFYLCLWILFINNVDYKVYMISIFMHRSYMSHIMHEKTCLCHMRTTKTQISLRIQKFKTLSSFCSWAGSFDVLPDRKPRIHVFSHDMSPTGGCPLLQYSPVNPYSPSGLFHPYQLGKSISIFRGGWCTIHFHLILDRNSYKQTVKTLRRLIWICTVCLCLKKWDARLIWVNLLSSSHHSTGFCVPSTRTKQLP